MSWELLAAGSDNAFGINGMTAGDVCIVDLDANNLPVTNPLTNLSRVKFHSDFDYLGVEKIVKSTDPGMSALFLSPNRTQVLFAHGLDRLPLLEGTLTRPSGSKRAWSGTVITGLGGAGFNHQRAYLHADGTNVYATLVGTAGLLEYWNWEIRLYQRAFAQSPAGDEAFYMGGDAIRARKGAFDTANRYPRAQGGTGHRITAGKSIAIRTGTYAGQPTLEGSEDAMTFQWAFSGHSDMPVPGAFYVQPNTEVDF